MPCQKRKFVLQMLILFFLGSKMYVCEIATQGFFFQETANSDQTSKGIEAAIADSGYLQCARKGSCNYVVSIKKNKAVDHIEVKEENELEKLKNKTAVWKKHAPKAFKDCKEAYDLGIRTTGKMNISGNGKHYFTAYCDMATDGGGWTVFQRRIGPTPNFQRSWAKYKRGFGNISASFWLGLDAISYLSSEGNVTLVINLEMQGERGYAAYSDFSVASEKYNYQLKLQYRSGNIGDSMIANNGMIFSTFDNDHEATMASTTNGPWWHSSTYNSNLNNDYTKFTLTSPLAMSWKTWKGNYGGGIGFSEMKLRRDD